MLRHLITSVLLTASLASAGAAETVAVKAIEFSDIRGWAEDDHAAALKTFQNTCVYARENQFTDAEFWTATCDIAEANPDARLFFETLFQPVLIEDEDRALFTGYYEPEIEGALTPSETFATPLYSLPDEVEKGVPYFTRADIMDGALADKGLELVWVADPVEAFFLQIQGSGRIKLPGGGHMRLGYAGFNGHKYKSIGKELVDQGVFELHEVSAARIKNWVKDNPEEGRALLATNPSYVFFRKIKTLDTADGPIGAMGIPITAERTIAIDPKYVPLGAPVWIDKRGRDPMRRLMIAQDVGSAIKGAQRADIFYGTGKEAGRIAGRTRARGRIYVLLPNAAFLDLAKAGLVQ